MDQNIVRGKCSLTLSAGAYTGTLSVKDTAYVDGGKYMFKPGTTSTEAATININGIGAKSVYKPGLVKINVGDLRADHWYEMIYNSTIDGFQVNLPKVIVAEYDFSVSGGGVGTIDLMTANIPTGLLLKLHDVTIHTRTAPTSSGDALIGFGITDNPYLIHRRTPYSASIFSTSVPFTYSNQPYGSFTLSNPGVGQVDTVVVGGVNVLPSAVAYVTSLAVTAANVAFKINNNPNGNIRAQALGAVVYLYRVVSQQYIRPFSGSSAEYTVTATSSGGILVGSFVDLGSTSPGRNEDAESWISGASKKVTITISGADLTAGKFRLFLPYEVI